MSSNLISRTTFEFTLEELKLIYRTLEHEYIKDNRMRELLNRIQEMINGNETDKRV